MDAVKMEIDTENFLPSTTSTAASQLIHIEQESEEEMHIPFTFVDVNVSWDGLYCLLIKLVSTHFFKLVPHVLILWFLNFCYIPH